MIYLLQYDTVMSQFVYNYYLHIFISVLYNTASQWSFGVVCWEVFSFGKEPYTGVEHQHILQHIESGNRLPKGSLCRDEM